MTYLKKSCKMHNSNTISKPRDPFFDLLKVWAIFMVIVQHMIAACGYGLNMMNTPVGKIICMFNMPLFMGITGYFFRKSLTLSIRDIFKSKWISWLRPTLIFSILLVGWRLLVGVLPYPDMWKKVVVYFLYDFLACYWFIPVAFLCCLISRISYKIYPNIAISGLIQWLVLVIFPFGNFYPILAYLKAMYPFFILGLLCRYYDWISIIRKQPLIIGLCSLILFILLFPWFNKYRFFYSFTIISVQEMIINYGALLVAGISGSILSIIFIHFMDKYNLLGNPYLSKLGNKRFQFI